MQHRTTFPEPVDFDMIYFVCPVEKRQVNYTDCWEISVYRFLHLVFSDDGEIRFDWLAELMDLSKKQCQMLVEFFHRYPRVERSAEYYSTPEGLAERAEWAKFLNASDCLYLKRKNMVVVQPEDGGHYEVAATLENLFSFFENFFPLIPLAQTPTDRSKLETLFEELSRFDRVLMLTHYSGNDVVQYKDHNIVFRLGDVASFRWTIYSYYTPIYSQNGEMIRRIRTGGHSEFRIERLFPEYVDGDDGDELGEGDEY